MLEPELRALLEKLPGKVSCELMVDWPCAGQVSLCWWDTSVEQIQRDNLHHFEGFDYRVLVDVDTEDTPWPIWQALAASLSIAPAYLAQRAELERLRLALEYYADRSNYLAPCVEEDEFGGRARAALREPQHGQ